MTLIVEDGTGLATAEAYCSVSYADTYHAARRNLAWAPIPTIEKEAFLRKAADYMIGNYRTKWKGFRVGSTQALDWPRNGVELEDMGSALIGQTVGVYDFIVPNTTVPEAVKQACADFALILSTGTELAPNLEPVVSREKVGPIEVEYNARSANWTIFRAVDMKLGPYLEGNAGGGMVRLERT